MILECMDIDDIDGTIAMLDRLDSELKGKKIRDKHIRRGTGK